MERIKCYFEKNRFFRTNTTDHLLPAMHNAFCKGLNMYGEESEELAFDMNYCFKNAPCKLEDFPKLEQIDMEIHKSLFLRHINSRWLTLFAAFERILSQLPAAQKYLVDFLPHRKEYGKTLPENKRYMRIQNFLKNENTLKTQMCFLKSIGPIFTNFLMIFEQIGPLVHLLFKHFKKMLGNISRAFIKTEEIKDKKESNPVFLNVQDARNQLELKDIEVGEETKRKQNFYVANAQHLWKNVPLDYKI